MAQKMFDIRHVDFSTDQLLTSVFQEMKDILNTQLHLHETMMRTSELYKTTYTEISKRMNTLEQKCPSLSPVLMSLMLDYSKIAVTSAEDGNSRNRKRRSPNKSLAKPKKPRKVKEEKSGQKQKTKKKKSTPATPLQPREMVEDTEEAVSFSSLMVDEPNLNGAWLDFTQLMEDIEQQEKHVTHVTAVDSSSGVIDQPITEDLYQEEKLTPLQKSCSVCRYNNMLRYISCNSGQIQCHVCCMDLMNCMCYYDEGGMMRDMISQDFEGHILSV